MKTLVGWILIIVGAIWSVGGLLYVAEGIYIAATTTAVADQASSSAKMLGGLALFGMGAVGVWAGRLLTRAAPR